MKLTTFLDLLRKGKDNHFIYAKDGKEGLVSVWEHKGLLVLTWEECPAGEQYNDSNYTRDEKHSFHTADELLAFLETRGLNPESFTP